MAIKNIEYIRKRLALLHQIKDAVEQAYAAGLPQGAITTALGAGVMGVERLETEIEIAEARLDDFLLEEAGKAPAGSA